MRSFCFVGLLAGLCICAQVPASEAREIDFKSSTQFIWGDDLRGDGEPLLANYLKLDYLKDDEKISLNAYGRVWKDFGSNKVRRHDDVFGRFYYLYADLEYFESTSLRLGRQFVNYSADSSILDGVTADFHDLYEHLGLAVSAGYDVKYGLDTDYSSDQDLMAGFDFYLKGYGATRLEVGYMRRYDGTDIARETFGLNASTYYKYLRPYTELRYSYLTESFDEAVIGADIMYWDKFKLKGEYYQSYPVFDATSIYSVFAVDQYREYLAQVDHFYGPKLTMLYSWKWQVYEDNDTASTARVGGRYRPTDKLIASAALDCRDGYGGRLWGVELYGDYRYDEKILVSAGMQSDVYHRPSDTEEWRDATRIWGGVRWSIKEDSSVDLRVEDNYNETFNNRPVVRVTLDVSF